MELLTFIAGSGGLAISAILILLLVLVVLWCVLPFAVFGLKRRVDVLIAETRKSNELLQAIQSSKPVLRRSTGPDPWAPPGSASSPPKEDA